MVLELSAKQLEWWNEATQEMDVSAGKFNVFVGSSSQDSDLEKISLELYD